MSGYVLHLPEEESVVLSGPAARRLVSAGNGDAALLYIALVQNRGAADGEKLRAALGWPPERFAADNPPFYDMGGGRSVRCFRYEEVSK